MTNSRSTTASWRGSLKVVVSSCLCLQGFPVRSRPRGTDHALNSTLTL
jgi:hypothetical protein